MQHLHFKQSKSQFTKIILFKKEVELPGGKYNQNHILKKKFSSKRKSSYLGGTKRHFKQSKSHFTEIILFKKEVELPGGNKEHR